MAGRIVSNEERTALATVLNETVEYLNWLKDEGLAQVEVAISETKPLEKLPVSALKSTQLRDSVSGAGAAASATGRQTPRFNPAPVSCDGRANRSGEPEGVQQGAGEKSSTTARVAAPREGGSEPLNRTLTAVAKDIEQCRKCALHKTRTRTVPGQGTPTPEILFVGEAPGADEDEQGLAFVGAAGQLLTKMVAAMGLSRDDVFIANILKCRPPGNRTPTPEEMQTCIPYLKEQIRILKPRVIVALGSTAVRGLLGVETGITRLRGQWHVFEGIDVMPTFHPAYLLRNPTTKRETWEDLKSVLRHIGRTPPSSVKPT